jgi:uncharacterized membrane protein
MEDRSSRPLALHLWAALMTLVSIGGAEAAPPAGKPVFIHIQGLAPTTVGMNGFIVAGDFTEGGAFQWMPTSGVTLVGGTNAYISRDGKAMVGSIIDSNGIQQAARWLGGTSWQALGPLVPGALRCDQSMSFAMSTSADGRVVVGGGYYGTDSAHPCDFYTAYRWEESTGYALMPTSDGNYTRAHTVSADGHVVVGIDAAPYGTWRGVKWVDGKEEFILGPLGNTVSAWAVNRDGSVIAGSGCTVDLPNQPPTAWSWTADGGVKCHTAEPPRWVPWIFGNNDFNYNTYIYATSDDGRVLGGNIQFDIAAGDEESVLWFDGEPVYLRDYLRGHGYPDAFEGHANTGRITAISPDGRVIVGHNGGPFGAVNRYGFIVILPELD